MTDEDMAAIVVFAFVLAFAVHLIRLVREELR
jgi:hypothetical protein